MPCGGGLLVALLICSARCHGRPPSICRYECLVGHMFRQRRDATLTSPCCCPRRVFDFDFQAPLDSAASAADYSREATFPLSALRDGAANAVAFWFTVKLAHDPDVDGPASELVDVPGWADLCSYPAEAAHCGATDSSRCWSQALFFLDSVQHLRAGDACKLVAQHGPSRVSFKLERAFDEQPK